MNKIMDFMKESGTSKFLIPAGLFLVIIGVIVLITTINNKDYIKVESTITNVVLAEEAYIDTEGNHVDATYDVTVKYTVDGKEYEQTLNGLSKQNIGDKMTIYYNPKDPTQITQTKSLLFPIIFITGGVLLLCGGIIGSINSIKRNKEQEE
jgi:hypothetical protein